MVRAGRSAVLAVPGLPAPAGSRAVAVSGDPARAGHAGAALVASLTAAVAASPAPVTEHAPAADARAFYGSAHAFEVVHSPTDLAAVAARARALCTTCAWCQQHSASAVCSLCADASVLAGPLPGAPGAEDHPPPVHHAHGALAGATAGGTP